MVIFSKIFKVRSITFNLFVPEGRKSAVKCKAEAHSPKIVDYMDALRMYDINLPKSILVVTDDNHIIREISEVQEKKFTFLDPEPAPRRIPDKVNHSFTFFVSLFSIFKRRERVAYISIERSRMHLIY